MAGSVDDRDKKAVELSNSLAKEKNREWKKKRGWKKKRRVD
jgi:hypothetical protein